MDRYASGQGVRLTSIPVPARWLIWFDHRAAALVVADGLDVYARLVRQTTDRQRCCLKLELNFGTGVCSETKVWQSCCQLEA